MNKETRTFIWGLIMLFICGTASCTHLVSIINNTFIYDYINYTLLIGSIIGSYIGISKIYSTIN